MTEDESNQPQDACAGVPDGSTSTEPALCKSESRLRTIIKTLEEGFCISDRLPGEPIDFRHVMANQAFQRQSGLGDPLGKTMRELVPTIDEETMAGYARVAATGEPEVFPVYALGRWFAIEAVATGQPGQIAVLFRDVTATRRPKRRYGKARSAKLFCSSIGRTPAQGPGRQT